MKIVRDTEIQRIAGTKSIGALIDAADAAFNSDDSAGHDYEDGVTTGIMLAELVGSRTIPHCTLRPEIFMVKYPDYVMDDGILFFVRPREELITRLGGLPEKTDEQ